MKRNSWITLAMTGTLVCLLSTSAFADAGQALAEISTPGYVWQTTGSIAAKKQFCNGTVYNYAGGQDDIWDYSLISVTGVTGIREYPGNGIKYIFDVSDGNSYYMYENDDSFLECHWGTDGYSMSDSLTRIGDNVTENTEMIDLSTYDERPLSFELNNISVFSGHDAAGNKEACLAANLKNPVQLRMGSQSVILHSIQIFGDPVDRFCEKQDVYFDIGEWDGYIVENSDGLSISGTLIEAHTAHHHTPVIMSVDALYY